MERKPDRNSVRKARAGSAEQCANIVNDSLKCGNPPSHLSFEISEQLKYTGYTVSLSWISWSTERVAAKDYYSFISSIRDPNSTIQAQYKLTDMLGSIQVVGAIDLYRSFIHKLFFFFKHQFPVLKMQPAIHTYIKTTTREKYFRRHRRF